LEVTISRCSKEPLLPEFGLRCWDFGGLQVRSDKSQALIIDLTSVPYVDSAGIGTLVGAYVNRHKDNRSLALVGVNDRVLNTLKISHVDKFFRRFDSLDAAEKEFA
jgi:anti-sigma B factor antagonist